MHKQRIEEAIAETHQFVSQYWKNNYIYTAQKLAQDVIWIGAAASEFFQGREEVTEYLYDSGNMVPRCHILLQEFWCIQRDTNTCTVAGRYLVTADRDCGEIFQEQHRITLMWRLEGKEFRVLHIHFSQPIGYLEEGERFPHRIGRLSYEYVQDFIKKYEGRYKKILFKDNKGHIYFLSETEIEYAEAKDHNTMICAVDETISGRIEWKNFLKMLGTDFVRVHRSFVVNCRYIKALRGCEVEMQSGVKIPVPVKKRKEIYNAISTVFCE